MKIVIAPDSFKESLAASDVAEAVKKGFIEAFPNAKYFLLPIADGEEGTVDSLVYALGGEKITLSTTDPLGRRSYSFYGLLNNGTCAVIEMAAASGLEKVPANKRDAKITTSFGTGELINDALNRGVTKFIIGLGGSATNDGGAGMLQALGVRLLDQFDNQISYGGRSLADLSKIDISAIDPRLSMCDIQVACYVSNPLTGNNGASAIFGPQKGATPEDIVELDDNLKHFPRLIKRDLNNDVEHIPGGCAAGGLGAAMIGFLGANLRSGIEIITDLLNIDFIIKEADLIITGEGKLDSQSLNGKVPIGIAKIAKKYHKPVIVLVGSLGDKLDAAYPYGISAMFSILRKISTLEQSLDPDEAKRNVYTSAKNIAFTLKVGMKVLKH